MDMNTLQYVVGEAKAGQPAVIRFFGRVTEETTSRFNDEFDFLENIIRPSCIRVLINSEGGSVLYGMSTYSTIANATVDTECIIEGSRHRWPPSSGRRASVLSCVIMPY